MEQKLTRDEWNKALDDIAVAAGQEWLKDMHDRKWKEANELGQKGVYEAVLERLMKEYPYDKVSNKDIRDIQDTKPLDWARWVNKTGGDPRAIAERAKMEKYLPLLKGIAEPDSSWLERGSQSLRYKSTDPEFGFKGNSEDFSEFINNLAKYQTIYDRGQILKELRNSGWYLPTKLGYPKMMSAVENAIANGENISTAKIAGLMGLDAGVNVGQFMAPSLNAVKSNPILTGAIDAGIQGGLEGGRQLGGDLIADVEPEYEQAPLASLLGLSRPALMSTAQASLSSLTGPNARQFARGFSRSTRAGNPVVAERASLEKRIDFFNKKWLDMKKKLDEVDLLDKLDKPMNVFAEPAEKVKMMEANMPSEFAEWAKIGRKADGTLDKTAILDYYDRMLPRSDLSYFKGVTKPNPEKQMGWHFFELPKVKKPGSVMPVYLGEKEYAVGKSLAPAKFAELEERNGWNTAGQVIGHMLGDFGGRFEPTFKVNPLTLDIKSEPEWGVYSEKTDDYKDSQWYRNLSDESKELIDKAFAKKAKK